MRQNLNWVRSINGIEDLSDEVIREIALEIAPHDYARVEVVNALSQHVRRHGMTVTPTFAVDFVRASLPGITVENVSNEYILELLQEVVRVQQQEQQPPHVQQVTYNRGGNDGVSTLDSACKVDRKL